VVVLIPSLSERPEQEKYRIQFVGGLMLGKDLELNQGRVVLSRSHFQCLPINRRSEVELLLSCARTHLDAETIERIHDLIQNDIDWDYLLRTALRHKIIPLLYRTLKKTCPLSVPDGILEQLRAYFLANTARNLFLTGELLKLTDRLQGQGILAIPFKGPVLAEYVYGDLSLRQFADLDILIYKRDALKARNVLVSDGYRPEIKLSIQQDKKYLKTEYYFTVISDEGRVTVELHWEMTGGNSYLLFDFGFLRDRLEPKALFGTKVLHLSPEDLIVYLCLHGCKDSWPNLQSISDVAELIRFCPAMGWAQVTHLAGMMRCERLVLLGLFLAHDLLGATLPVHIVKRIENDAKIPGLAMDVYRTLFDESGKCSVDEIGSRFSFFHMRVRNRLSEKIRYALYLTTSPTVEDWRRLPLPASLSFLHYLFRPIRLAVGLALSLLRRHVAKRKTTGSYGGARLEKA
jgi:hypothetical protein